MPPDLLAPLAQFGAAGLIAWLWLTERRTAAERDRQLSQAHERLMAERERMETLIGLVTESTRAMTALEASQRELARVVDRLAAVLTPQAPPAGAHHAAAAHPPPPVAQRAVG
ncbi:MAG TPA: hypothetical protein VFF69_13580 [Phycisphaerales bacterium]|nr:hypothetical protein [Phycisphaerales bacterium]